MTSGRKGSDYEPHIDTVIRLARWRRLASAGVPVDDIAVAVGVSREALEQMVYRARQHGHPDAIRHPRAGDVESFRHVIDSGYRARRIRSRASHSKTGASS